MTYHVSQLLEDSRLRTDLLNREFTVEDMTGEFGCLDFSQSMLKNHRAVFDRLCELGGEELLAEILEKAPSTAITDDPNAAKQGVRPIKGTEKFFLKTNAGAPTALASILSAISFWAQSQGRDPDETLLFHTEGEEDDMTSLDDFFDDEPRPELPDGLFPVVEPRRCSLVQKNGKYAFFDEDAKEFVSFPVGGDDPDAEDKPPVSEFARCQLMDDEKPQWGWKYKLEDSDDAKWGWISADGVNCLPPMFRSFGYPSVSVAIDFEEDEDPFPFGGPFSCSICRPLQAIFDTVCGDSDMDTDSLLFNRESYFLCPPAEEGPWRMERLRWVDDSKHPLKLKTSDLDSYDALHIERERFSGDMLLKIYSAFSDSDGAGLCYIHDSDYFCSQNDGIIIVRTPEGKEYRWPADKLNLSTIRQAIQQGDKYAEGLYFLMNYDDRSYYSLRREGRWAVARIAPDGCMELITPYAFTSQPKKLHDEFVLVERFGKKGVLNCADGSYPVPCDYEKIGKAVPSGNFIVRRMGYVGQITMDGTWSVHLHRENED